MYYNADYNAGVVAVNSKVVGLASDCLTLKCFKYYVQLLQLSYVGSLPLNSVSLL
jgi:hypothetical protein